MSRTTSDSGSHPIATGRGGEPSLDPIAPNPSDQLLAKMEFFDLTSEAPLPDMDGRAQLAQVPNVPVLGGMGHPGAENASVESNILMCACPDCSAPMSINTVLMAADCWRCQTSIELTEEQKAEVRRHLARQQAQQQAPQQRPSAAPTAASANPRPAATPSPRAVEPAAAVPPTAPAARRTATAAEAAREQPSSGSSAPARPTPPPPPPPAPNAKRKAPPSPLAAPTAAAGAAQPQRQPTRRPVARRKSFFNFPPWLISLVFHMVLMTLLALITLPSESHDPFITLSTEVSKNVREGGAVDAPMDEDLDLDLPLPKDTNLDDPSVRKAIVKADQDARELQLDPLAPDMPDLNQVKAAVANHGKTNASLIARDPRLRVEMVKREGGTTLTEAAVARGLRWISKHQMPDGRWSLHQFHTVEGCDCPPSRNAVHSDTAGTALALLPFLGAGQTHLVGRYREHVSRGLRWLLDQQAENGDLRGSWRGNSGMYAHGIASIVLCEAFLLTGDEQLRDPAQRAVNFIVDAQNAQGGWRYSPRSRDGDTSVLGWQLMALQSGRAAGLEVPESAFQLSSQYLDLVEYRPNYKRWLTGWKRRISAGPPKLMLLLEKDQWSIDDIHLIATYLEESKGTSVELDGMLSDYETLVKSGGRYGYQPKQSPTHVMTAEALLCRMYLGWNRDMPGMRDGAMYLLSKYPPSKDAPNIYYWYYGTQVFHHLGGEMWERWNTRMRDVLVLTQEKSGHEAGSWFDPRMRHATGGRLYMTSLSICTLEVYYRHLPIYRQINLDGK